MIRATTFAGRRVAVFGLGSSGNATALSLIAGGAEVLAWDDGEAARAAAAKLGIPLADLKSVDWSDIAGLVLAPGVPLTHPKPHWVVLKAREESSRRTSGGQPGVEIIGDVEIFLRERAAHAPLAPLVCITGTNGKSTTTALIAHLLSCLGHAVEMGGNIGKPVLTLAAPSEDRVHVLELSSFQIDLTPSFAAPSLTTATPLPMSVGVLLNITPDHIDRHGTVENYAAVKERMLAGSAIACVGVDDAFTSAIAERIEPASRLCAFTTGKGAAIIPRIYAIGTTLFAHEREGAYTASQEIASLDGIGTLRGRHNVQNALAALAALRALQMLLDARSPVDASKPLQVWQPGRMQPALASYPGLPHRMEQVGKRGDVLFINDSKATNADSTEKALLSWDKGIYWILGGKPKEGGIETLRALFPRVTKAYLIGAASDEFAATLSGAVPFERCGTLRNAVERAAHDAALDMAETQLSEAVVLLSPACASYDQFPNFERRGDDFRQFVREIIDSSRSGAPS